MTKKKNTSPMKKLLPAVGMLAISATMLGTSTYAWFTMNKDVEVTGMEVRTKVGSNLLICSTNIENDYRSDVLGQTRQALLEPVSSVNGTDGSFFYTVDAAADGQKIHGTTGTDEDFVFGTYAEGTDYANALAGKTKYDPSFNSIYTILSSGTAPSGTGFDEGTPAYGYVDYTFYLKATGESASQNIKMNVCNLIYSGNGSGAQALGSGTGNTGDQAWRIAVFASDITANGGKGYLDNEKPAFAEDNQKGLLKLANAAYFTDGKAVKKDADANAMTGWLDTVVNAADPNGVIIGSVNAGQTAYYKVTVRLWLEGEDTTCTSETYALLTDSYKLDLEFTLDTTKTAVTAIGTDTGVASSIEAKTPKVSGTDYDGGTHTSGT
jgi:hypothetical protein